MIGCNAAVTMRRGVRAIFIRIATVFLAIFAAGLVITPVERSARNGGFAGGHAIAFHGGFPGQNGRYGFPADLWAQPRGEAFPAAAICGRGAPWGAWGYAPSDLGYYEPPAVVTEEQPSEGPSPAPPPPRRGCATQIYKVPSETGGEIPVKVVRC